MYSAEGVVDLSEYRKSSPAPVVIYLSIDEEGAGESVGFSSDGEECSNDGPDLWITRKEWEGLGRPEQVKVTIETSMSR
jgi:hypothetical protein